MDDLAARLGRTIAAPATARGRGALAVVRVSGPATGQITRSVFSPSGHARWPTRKATVGRIKDRHGRLVDQGTAVFWAGPRSYTGEDLLEVTTHGSPVVVDAVVQACLDAGAIAALPGEFTWRALRAGKIDLSQAEAVADLVEASTLEQARVAARQAEGEVARELEPIAGEALRLLADLEASLDFEEDEDLGLQASEIVRRAGAIAEAIATLVERSQRAGRVVDGASVVLLGPPNAGKSSLFNALVGRARAIVTEEPGTTRDVLEAMITLDGLPVRLVDGAGVRETSSLAEGEGVRRVLAEAERAALVVEVYDATDSYRPPRDEDETRLWVGTRLDLVDRASRTEGSVRLVDAVGGEGVEALAREIARLLEAPGAAPLESVALASRRHREAAERARSCLVRAVSEASPSSGAVDLECVALDVREAVRSLESILGGVDVERILGEVFSRHCIGK